MEWVVGLALENNKGVWVMKNKESTRQKERSILGVCSGYPNKQAHTLHQADIHVLGSIIGLSMALSIVHAVHGRV